MRRPLLFTVLCLVLSLAALAPSIMDSYNMAGSARYVGVSSTGRESIYIHQSNQGRIWLKVLLKPTGDMPADVARDLGGEVQGMVTDGDYLYIVGPALSFNGTFIAKLRATDGKLIWFKVINQTCADSGITLYGGYIYIFLVETSTWGLYWDSFFLKLRATDGKLIWSMKIEGVYVKDIAAYRGYLYATGKVRQNELDCCIIKLRLSDGSPQWYNRQGRWVPWMRYFGGDGDECGYAIAVRGNAIYLAGSTSTSSFLADRRGRYNGFFAIVGTVPGSLGSLRTISGTVSVIDIAVYGDYIYLAGKTESGCFIAKVDSRDYRVCWFKTFRVERGYCTNIVPVGHYVYVTGAWGYPPIYFIARFYDQNGSLHFIRTLGSPIKTIRSIIAYDNHLYIAGKALCSETIFSAENAYIARMSLEYLSGSNPRSLAWSGSEEWPSVRARPSGIQCSDATVNMRGFTLNPETLNKSFGHFSRHIMMSDETWDVGVHSAYYPEALLLVSTDKASYMEGEVARITVEFINGSAGIPDAMVFIKVASPLGAWGPYYILTGRTNEDGVASFRFKISPRYSPGPYRIYVTAYHPLHGTVATETDFSIVSRHPNYQVTLVGTRATVTGREVNLTLNIRNFGSNDVTIYAIASAQHVDTGYTPQPTYSRVRLSPRSLKTVKLTLLLPEDAPTGEYTIYVILSTGMPDNRGFVITYAEKTVTIGE